MRFHGDALEFTAFGQLTQHQLPIFGLDTKHRLEQRAPTRPLAVLGTINQPTARPVVEQRVLRQVHARTPFDPCALERAELSVGELQLQRQGSEQPELRCLESRRQELVAQL